MCNKFNDSGIPAVYSPVAQPTVSDDCTGGFGIFREYFQ